MVRRAGWERKRLPHEISERYVCGGGSSRGSVVPHSTPGPCFPWVGCGVTRGAPKVRAPIQCVDRTAPTSELEGHDPCLGRVMLLPLGLEVGHRANGTFEPQGLRECAGLGPVPPDPEHTCTC